MNARFKELRKALGLTQEEFAEKTKLSRSYINLIEMGKKVPAERTTQDICRIFNVNCDWLVHGEGDMFQDTNLDFGNVCALIGANDEKAKAAIIHGAFHRQRKRGLTSPPLFFLMESFYKSVNHRNKFRNLNLFHHRQNLLFVLLHSFFVTHADPPLAVPWLKL